MNSQIKVYKLTSPTWFVPFIKIATGKTSIEVRQLWLISRIMASIFTIGLMGYTIDRLRRYYKSVK